MEIRQQVDQIIAHRKEKARELDAQKNQLKELLMALKKLRQLEHNGFVMKDDALKREFQNKVQALQLMAVIRQTEALLQTFEQVISRFNRDYISIATIGKERQGKSRFLQAVSRLDNKVIPAYSGTSCTGATSVIWNDPSVPKGAVRALITYRKREEVIALVQGYVSAITSEYPVDKIEFDDIESLPLKFLKEHAGTSASKLTSYTHLEKIVQHFPEFKHLYDSPPQTFTDKEVIKRIVAQNNGVSVDQVGKAEQYYSYLAVERADIYCQYFFDCGNVRLIDTVGIESTQLGVEQAMLDTVKNESDAAIVVTRPVADAQEKDVEIYSEIIKQFEDKAPEKWLFYLVNHVTGENDNTVVGFDRSISGWGIAGHQVVDCNDPEDVNQNFMKPMLDTLLANIDAIDATYIRELNEKDRILQQTIAVLLQYIDNLSDNNFGGIQGTQALEKGKQCFNKIGTQLRDVVNHYANERREPNYILWNAIQKILNNLDGDLNPSAEAIQRVADSNNVIGSDVWNIVLHYVRNEITRRFAEIDDELAKENIRFKNSLVNVLYTNLKELFGEGGDINDDSIDMTAMLREMMEKTIAGNPKYAQIYDAIVFLDNFQFNTRATLIQAVRSQLSIINPLCEEYANPQTNFFVRHCGKEIDYYLTSRLSLIEENLRHALMDIYHTPNEAFFAAAEEFYDRLTFAAADLSTGRIVNMSDVWGLFFQEYSHLIWKEQAQDIAMLNDLVTQIKALRPLLQACSKSTN